MALPGYCRTIGNLYVNQMLPRSWQKKQFFLSVYIVNLVCILYSFGSLHFVPKVWILYSVCRLHFVPSLHFVLGLHFVNSLHFVLVCSLHFVLTVWPGRLTGFYYEVALSWMNQTTPPLNLPLKADIKSTIPTQNLLFYKKMKLKAVRWSYK